MSNDNSNQREIGKTRFLKKQCRTGGRDFCFNNTLSIEADKLEPLVVELDAELRPFAKRARRKDQIASAIRRYGAIFANGLQAGVQECPVHYSRNYKSYRGDTPRWTAPKGFLRQVDTLGAAGFIDSQKAEPSLCGGPQSTLALTDKALLLAEQHGVSIADVVLVPADYRPVILRDADGVSIRLDRSDEYVAMTIREVEQIREQLESHTITYLSESRDLVVVTNAPITRIFNHGSFSSCGRFFRAEWHTMKKAERRTVKIDGEDTIELDFRSLFPSIAYHKVGANPHEDCYAVPLLMKAAEAHNKEWCGVRNSIKKLINTDFNARTQLKYFDAAFAGMKGVKIREAAEMAWSYNEPIAGFKNKGIGLEFMNIESQIANLVHKAGIGAGIPVLSIHDSFRVRARDASWLREVMNKAYFEVVHGTPIID